MWALGLRDLINEHQPGRGHAGRAAAPAGMAAATGAAGGACHGVCAAASG
jgi:hypothetical protein